MHSLQPRLKLVNGNKICRNKQIPCAFESRKTNFFLNMRIGVQPIKKRKVLIKNV